ncbi:hypothetical protein QT971_20425 [Microcoleus sp. herbarium19]
MPCPYKDYVSHTPEKCCIFHPGFRETDTDRPGTLYPIARSTFPK